MAQRTGLDDLVVSWGRKHVGKTFHETWMADPGYEAWMRAHVTAPTERQRLFMDYTEGINQSVRENVHTRRQAAAAGQSSQKESASGRGSADGGSKKADDDKPTADDEGDVNRLREQVRGLRLMLMTERDDHTKYREAAEREMEKLAIENDELASEKGRLAKVVSEMRVQMRLAQESLARSGQALGAEEGYVLPRTPSS
jgi:hypothetical protein